MEKKELEQTLVLIKPDALRNSLTGYVLSLLSEFHTGLRFAGAKIVHVSRMLAEEHYAEHKGKSFYPPLIEYITGSIHYKEEAWRRRVVAIVYQGPDAIKRVREIGGPTHPSVARETKPGCIRSLGTAVPIRDAAGSIIGERLDNLIHASSSEGDAEREIKLWFRPTDIPPLMRAYATQSADEHYYYRNGLLFTKHEPGSVCLLAPGDTAWESDLFALKLLRQGLPSPVPVGTVAAKYLINELMAD